MRHISHTIVSQFYQKMDDIKETYIDVFDHNTTLRVADGSDDDGGLSKEFRD